MAANKRFYLLTYQRTGSNLLLRLLSKQPGLEERSGKPGAGYFFLPIILSDKLEPIRDKGYENLAPGEEEALAAGYQDCFSCMGEHLDAAKASGKTAFVKEHIHFLLDPKVRTSFFNTGKLGDDRVSWSLPQGQARTNITLLSDEFLRTWTPVFLIRHPALSIVSQLRADFDKDVPAELTTRQMDSLKLRTFATLARAMFEFYYPDYDTARSTGPAPIIVDADDVMTPDSPVVKKLCQRLGLDPSKVAKEWPIATAEKIAAEKDDFQRRMTARLDFSTSIIPSRTSTNIDTQKWREEWGEKVSAALGKAVKEMMPDYLFMWQQRLQA